MDGIHDAAKGGLRRIEVLSGAARRRRWSPAEQGRSVAETLEAGATVTEGARRGQVCPQQVWGGRREARAGELAVPSGAAVPTEPHFVPIVGEPASRIADGIGPTADRTTRLSTPPLEIERAGAVERVAVGTDGALLTEGRRAVPASAA